MADPDAPEARFRGTRWPGLIWAVPVAAALIVAWLGVAALATRGPEVVVTFPITGGIRPGGTDVTYRGATVGHVVSVHLDASLVAMKVRLRFDPDMDGHLGRGTRYWIAGRHVSFGNLASLKSVIAGPHIAVAPRNGPIRHHAAGLAHAPAVNPAKAGLTVMLTAAKKGNISTGAGIFYKGFRIGTVRKIALGPNGGGFAIGAFISRRYQRLITTRSRFWNAGGVRVTASGGGPRLAMQSVPALVSGALGVTTPPGGRQAIDGARFRLYPSAAAARDAPGPHAVAYRTVLPGGPRGLAVGAPVMLEGATVGAVTGVAMAYAPRAGAIRSTVRFALDPSRIGLAGAAWNLRHPRPQMNAMLARLIHRGLRAHLARATPMIGQQELALAIMRGAAPATLGKGSPPAVPGVAGGSIGRLMAEAGGILANLHAVSARLAALSRAPRTRATLKRLAQTAANVAAITRTTRGQAPHLLADLRRTSNEANAALRDLRGMIGAEGSAANAPESQTMPHTLYELGRTARALRELVDELNAHPNALILGKGR